MHPRIGRIVRPLLDCRRGALRAWLARRALPFVEDETNADVSIARNRVRVELVTLLASRFNASIVDVLADQAELARDLYAWMDAEAAALEARAVRPLDAPAGGVARAVDIGALASAPVALQRAVLWRVMR
jgi:tRNA(Ile)-lysidine synthase